MRTNIDLDDSLIEKAMQVSGLKTKKEVVNRALAEFVEQYSRKDLKELRGKIEFDRDYDYKVYREGR